MKPSGAMDERIKQEVAEQSAYARSIKWSIDAPRGPDIWVDDMDEHGGTVEEIQYATSHWLSEKAQTLGGQFPEPAFYGSG